MRRPNLAAHPFLDVRPVWVAGGVLAAVALTLTGISVGELVRVQRTEKDAAAKLAQLQTRRTELAAQVAAANRRLAAVSWKKLQFETASLQDVVARRRLVWSQLLADLERVMPREIRLVSIMPSVSREGDARVAISGVATSREAWLRLLAVLFTDRKFSDPMPSSEEAPSASNSQGYKFQLTFTYLAEGRS